MCLDLNTMESCWVPGCLLDDPNSTPVLSVENGHLYLYVSTSFRLGWRSYQSRHRTCMEDQSAETGEIIWQRDYQCYTDDGVSRRRTIHHCIRQKSSERLCLCHCIKNKRITQPAFLTVSTKKPEKKIWEHKAGYAWSSPVCVYDKEGHGSVIYCSSDGNMYLLDGKTGQVYDTLSLSEGVIEASPAVYGNTVVVGTRDCKIWGVKLG